MINPIGRLYNISTKLVPEKLNPYAQSPKTAVQPVPPVERVPFIMDLGSSGEDLSFLAHDENMLREKRLDELARAKGNEIMLTPDELRALRLPGKGSVLDVYG